MTKSFRHQKARCSECLTEAQKHLTTVISAFYRFYFCLAERLADWLTEDVAAKGGNSGRRDNGAVGRSQKGCEGVTAALSRRLKGAVAADGKSVSPSGCPDIV